MLYSRTSREAGITYAYAPGDRIPDTEDANIKGNPGAYIYAIDDQFHDQKVGQDSFNLPIAVNA